MPTPEQMQASIDQINADLAAMRQAKGSGYLAGFPKWVVIGIALWVAAIETADKLPQLMLTYPRYEAALAEAKFKILQPELLTAQIAAAKFEADAAQYKPATSLALLSKANGDAIIATMDAMAAPNKPPLMAANLEKAQYDAKAASLQPQINAVTLAKLGVDTKTAAFQQTLTASNSIQAAQGTAMTNAALAASIPLMMNMLKQFGIDLPMDQLAPMMGIIDPQARTQDLQSAMPNAKPQPVPSQQATRQQTPAARPAVSEAYSLGVSARDSWNNWQNSAMGTNGAAAKFVRAHPTAACDGKEANALTASGDSDFKRYCQQAKDSGRNPTRVAGSGICGEAAKAAVNDDGPGTLRTLALIS